MKLEDQKVKFVNSSMNTIYDLCDELYEIIIDEDFTNVDNIVRDIMEILQDLNQTFQDEI